MNKKVKRGLTIFILIAIIIGGFYAYRKLNLMIKEDIVLDLEDNYESIWLQYAEHYDFSTSAEINNYWLCKAICVNNIIDISNGEILLNESFYVTNNKKKTTTATIKPNKGYGQAIYQYEITCKNIPTNNCPAGEGSYVRRNTLVVNYEPNDFQKEVITQAIYLFNNLSYNIAYSELNINNATNILYNLDINFPKSLKDDASDYNTILRQLQNSEKNIISDWDNDEYEKANDKISIIYRSAIELIHNTSILINSINDIVYKHNFIVRTHKDDLFKALKIRDMLKYYPGNVNEFNNDAMTSLSLVNINTVKMNKLSDYDSLVREAQLEKAKIEETINIFDSKIIQTKSDYVDIYLADALSCSVLGCNQTIINYSLLSLDDAINRCNLYDIIMPRLIKAQNITKNSRAQYNNSLSDIYNEEIRHIAYLLNNIQVNDSSINTKIVEYLSILNLTTSNSSIDIDISSRNNFGYYSLDFEPMINSLNNISSYCNRAEKNFTFDTYIIQEQIIPEFVQQPEMQTIGQPMKKCCVYGKCDECQSEKNNPLILLHGHSFNQKNSAYQSTDIFNQLENNLIDEKYVSLGIWKPYSNPKDAIMISALFKPTYYITIYDDILGTNKVLGTDNVLGTKIIQSKDESIEVYSNRLKDFIDNIKLITGKDKVDIVAHSMGGLVTRRYIQKYGPDSIDNFILIGTPNSGITDRVYSGCKVFGNSIECDEMHQGSDFLKLVNQNYSMPQTYVIIGRGCDMQGVDGDGVVNVDNAKLDNYKTYYIDGKCTGTSLLHNSMLNREDVARRIINIID